MPMPVPCHANFRKRGGISPACLPSCHYYRPRFFSSSHFYPSQVAWAPVTSYYPLSSIGSSAANVVLLVFVHRNVDRRRPKTSVDAIGANVVVGCKRKPSKNLSQLSGSMEQCLYLTDDSTKDRNQSQSKTLPPLLLLPFRA